MAQAFAVVRHGQEVIAAGASLSEAMTSAVRSFYSSALPPTLEVLEQGFDPLPALAALPCSEALLAASHSPFGPGPVTLLHGILCLDSEASNVDPDQLPLF